MHRSILKGIVLFSLLFLVAVLLLQLGGAASDSPNNARSAEKINLALRRTAHYLLKEVGDSTTRILPVQQNSDSSWLIRLPHPFNYSTLPGLLQASFELYDIRENYHVAILRCSDGELLLGYAYLDYRQNNDVPCGGRDMHSDCYELQVSFPNNRLQKGRQPLLLWAMAFTGLLAAAILAFGWKKKPQPEQEEQQANGAAAGWLQFGNSRLDLHRHRLLCAGEPVSLTYREAKLLQLFASQPNQVLSRDFIMENIWADEGILVGRSLDVFVSRLRKKLQADPSLGIAAVHGIGYRLEVRP